MPSWHAASVLVSLAIRLTSYKVGRSLATVLDPQEGSCDKTP